MRVRDGRAEGAPLLVKPDAGRSVPLGFTVSGAYYYGISTAGSDVYVVPIDPASHRATDRPVLVTEHFAGSNGSPEWSPDGKSLLFITQRGAAFSRSVDAGHLAIRSLASGQQREVRTPLRRFYRPRWSRDGALLVAAADPTGTLGWYRLHHDTGSYERLRLGDHDESVSEVEWAGDAHAVFYHLRDAAGSTIIRRSLVDQASTVLARFAASAGLRGLSGSPDGRHLAFSTVDVRSGETVLHAGPASGSEAIELLRLGPHETIAASSTGSALPWTPASDAVLFVKRRRGGNDARGEAWKVTLATRRAEPLGLSMPGLAGLRVRGDGRALAFTVLGGGAEVWVMDNFLPKGTP
jgi:hypothetical protein